MRARRFQTTLNGPCSVSGRGYWTGAPVTVTFLPAPADSGICFFRDDIPHFPSVDALATSRVGMPMRTGLKADECEVDMVEHIMSALYGLQIDNAEVHVTSPEMPGMDGSSLAYVLALDSVGKTQLRSRRETFCVRETLRVANGRSWIEVHPTGSSRLEIEYRLDYGKDSSIGCATFEIALNEDNYYHQVAPARTFISQAEAESLQSQGLARHVTERDLLVFGDEGPINNQLRFADECARHKALDLIGDLALAGIDVIGRVVAYRSGHQLNGQMAEMIRTVYEADINVASSRSRKVA